MSALARHGFTAPGADGRRPPPGTGAAPDSPACAEEAMDATVLVVDGDGVSRRFVELALAREGGFEVETALDGAGALDILAHTPVHAIIAETELIDMNGLYFFRRLSTENRLRHIPFVFLSSDARVTTLAMSFSAGVDDFLVKPCDVVELVARLRGLVVRRRLALAAARRRSYMLAGHFSALAFPDLVSIIEQERRSGTLAVVGAASVGAIYFDQGQVVHALYGGLVGPRAFQEIMTDEEAQFELTQEPCPVAGRERTIRVTATQLILEAARAIDDDNHERGGAARPAARRATAVEALGEPRPSAPVAPAALAPSAAAQIEHGIRDGFALGELRMYTPAELAGWTRATGGRQRFHVTLLADLTEGVSALLALAAAPNERFVQGGLGTEPKALGLNFFLRHERLVDVVLLDVLRPRTFQASLQRTPSLVILAPPGGDFLAIGTKARVELEQLLHHLRPPAVVAVGNQALAPTLRSLRCLGDRTALRAVEGVLGQGPGDLREAVIAGLRLHAGGAA